MNSSFFTVLMLKIKYSLNVTHYFSKSTIFNKKQDKISSYNVFDVAFKAFYKYFIKKFMIVFALIIAFAFIPLQGYFEVNLENIFLLTLFLSLSVGLISSALNDFTEDAVYAVDYLKMKYSAYFKSNYIIKLFMQALTFFIAVMSIDLLYEFDFFTYKQGLILTFVYMSIRNLGILFNLIIMEKKKTKYVFSAFLLALGYVCLYFNLQVNEAQFYIIYIFLVLINIAVLYKMFCYKKYDELYNTLYDQYRRKQVKLKSYEDKKLANGLYLAEVKKTKNPYKNFIKTFEKRYEKVLPKIFGFSSVLIFLISIYVIFKMAGDDTLKEYAYAGIKYALPFFVLVLCFINSSRVIVRNFYEKCDKYMLEHNFYQNKKTAMKIYIEKLKFITKNNLLKTNVLAFALVIIYYLTGFDINILEYLIIIISLNLIMIIFSMYYLTVVYFYNPFKENLEKVKIFNLFVLFLPHYCAFNIFDDVMHIYMFGIYSLASFVFFCILNYVLLKIKLNK